MGPLIIAIFVIVLFVIIGAVIFLLVYQKKLKEQAAVEEATGSTMKDEGFTTQQFLPFKTIEDGIVDLGNHEYRVYIECTSINYGLKTAAEQDVLEKSFQRFINSFSFPFAFYIQTREIDAREIITNIENDVKRVGQTYMGYQGEGLRRYAQQYLNDIVDLHNRTLQTTKQRKKYIIVTYDDANFLTELNDEEKKKRAYEQIVLRANSIVSGLNSLGIHGHILNQKEAIELIFRAINKEAVGALDGVLSGEFMSPIVSGNTLRGRYETLHPAGKMDIMITNLLDGLDSEIIRNNTADDESRETAEAVYNEVQKIREKYAGWFKSSRRGGY